MACKFLRKWTTLSPPTCLRELQQLLGKLLWCSGFVPEFKELIRPIEALLSPQSEGVWTAECTAACNKLVQVIFGRITLTSADPHKMIYAYPSLGEHVGFLALTQSVRGVERPVAFLSRYLTKTEQKWGELEQLVSVLSWGLRKARRYTSLCPQIVVRVGDAAEVACISDRQCHLRLQALLVDLSLYKVTWEAAGNPWCLGEEVAAQQLPTSDDQEELTAPVMVHQEVSVKRPSGRSYTVEALHAAQGHVIVQFDGGAAGRLGTGGTLLWGAQGQLLAAWAWRFGADAPTNNAAEV